MRADRNIRLLEAHAVCINMAFIIPVVVPFYRERMGLGFDDFLMAEAAFALTVVVLEVPSGWLSDVWKRCHVLLAGTLVELVGYALMLAADNLWMAMLAQSVIGVGISLLSGTNTALLYDSLLSEGREAEYRRHEGRRMGLGFYSVAAASVMGGFFYAADVRLPVILTLVTLAIGALCCLLMAEPERHRRAAEKHPIADMIATARYAMAGHAEIGLIIAFAAVMFSATKVVMWAQQPYYAALGLQEETYGLLMAAGFTLAGLSSHFAHLLDGKVSSLKALFIVWLVAVACCVLASLSISWGGVCLLMLAGSCLYGMAAPRVSEAINKNVGSERRATILSTQSLITSLAFIPLSIGMGHVAENHGVNIMLVAMAGWLSMAGLALMLWCLRKRFRAARIKPAA